MNKYTLFCWELYAMDGSATRLEIELDGSLRSYPEADRPGVIHAQLEKHGLDPSRYNVRVDSQIVEGKGYSVRIDAKGNANRPSNFN